LDQSIRIVQASIDVLTELGFLSSCETMITLLQAIKSARWPTDGPLSILPGVDVDKEKQRLEHANAQPKTLIDATAAAPAVLERALKFAGVSHAAIKRASEPIARLPLLKLDLGAFNALSLTLHLSRQNPARLTQGGIRIFAPRYPKPQTEGFFVILSYSGTDEIIALKRVGWHDPARNNNAGGRGGRGANAAGANSRLHASARISLPPEAQGKKVDVVVHSDSYPGMRWGMQGVEVPMAPLVPAGGKEKEKGGA
jgi:antiviral helicase SLH1